LSVVDARRAEKVTQQFIPPDCDLVKTSEYYVAKENLAALPVPRDSFL
jgi:hypothetical protein